MLSFTELEDGRDYIATDLQGKKYRGTFVDRYIPGGIFFCCFPRFLEDGRTKNRIISYEEAE